MIWAQNNKNIVLRQFGTGVSAFNEIAEKAKEDLGFTLQMTALDSDAVVQRVVTQPNSFDIGDIEYWMVKKIFPAKTLQAMDTKKIKLLRQDRADLHDRQAEARHDDRPGHRAAHRRLRRGQGLGRLRQGATQWFTMIPTIYNADTLGIRPDLVGRPITQWKDILDPEVQGQDLDPEHPVDRHHGRRDDLRVGRHHEVRRQGQHDQGRRSTRRSTS